MRYTVETKAHRVTTHADTAGQAVYFAAGRLLSGRCQNVNALLIGQVDSDGQVERFQAYISNGSWELEPVGGLITVTPDPVR